MEDGGGIYDAEIEHIMSNGDVFPDPFQTKAGTVFSQSILEPMPCRHLETRGHDLYKIGDPGCGVGLSQRDGPTVVTIGSE